MWLDGAFCAQVTMGALRGSKLWGILEAQESLQPFAYCPLSACTALWHMPWRETWAKTADFIFPCVS